MLLFLVRHGEAEHNVGLMEGNDDTQSRLTDKGREQAAATGEYLSDYKFDLVVTSALPRAIETASLMVGKSNIALSHELFNEVGPRNLPDTVLLDAKTILGTFEDEFKHDPIGYQLKYRDVIKGLDKKFKVKETIEHTEKQVKSAIRYLEDLGNGKCKGKYVLLVAHSGIILDMVTEALQLPFMVVPLGKGKNPKGNCSITILKYKGKKWSLVVPTSTSHVDMI